MLRLDFWRSDGFLLNLDGVVPNRSLFLKIWRGPEATKEKRAKRGTSWPPCSDLERRALIVPFALLQRRQRHH